MQSRLQLTQILMAPEIADPPLARGPELSARVALARCCCLDEQSDRLRPIFHILLPDFDAVSADQRGSLFTERDSRRSGIDGERGRKARCREPQGTRTYGWDSVKKRVIRMNSIDARGH
jgi:hypothetical protein